MRLGSSVKLVQKKLPTNSLNSREISLVHQSVQLWKDALQRPTISMCHAKLITEKMSAFGFSVLITMFALFLRLTLTLRRMPHWLESSCWKWRTHAVFRMHQQLLITISNSHKKLSKNSQELCSKEQRMEVWVSRLANCLSRKVLKILWVNSLASVNSCTTICTPSKYKCTRKWDWESKQWSLLSSRRVERKMMRRRTKINMEENRLPRPRKLKERKRSSSSSDTHTQEFSFELR